MDQGPDDMAAISFVRLCRSQPDGSVVELVLSRAAMHLHTFGVLTGIDSATPGFVSDRYLSSLRTETTLPALELVLAGLWQRDVGGYQVSDPDVRAVVQRLHGDLNALETRCTAEGGHRYVLGQDQCRRCGAVSRRARRATRGVAAPADWPQAG